MRFTILTVARTKESTSCRSPDIDFAARTRGLQMFKVARPNNLWSPSNQEIELLNELIVDGKPSGEHVFKARNPRAHLGTSAVL